VADWYYASFLGATLFAVIAVLDKRLVGHLFPSFRVFIITFGLLQFQRSGVLFIIAFLTTGLEGGSGILWAAASGVFWAVGMSLYFCGLSMEEVSRIAPMQAITPVFTVIIAVLLFGEEMTPTQWGGMLTVVAGVVLINLRPEGGRIRFVRRKTFVVLLASAACLAWGFITTDEATERMNAMSTEAFRTLVKGASILALTWRPRHTPLVLRTLRSPRVAGAMLFNEGILALVAMLTFAYALSAGPVALVSTIFSAWPLGVLVLSTILSTPLWNVLGEPLDRRTLGMKAAATALIVAGIAAIGI